MVYVNHVWKSPADILAITLRRVGVSAHITTRWFIVYVNTVNNQIRAQRQFREATRLFISGSILLRNVLFRCSFTLETGFLTLSCSCSNCNAPRS